VDSDWNDILRDRTETATEYSIDTGAWIFVPGKATVKAFDLAGTYGVATEKRFFYYDCDLGRDFGDAIAAAGDPGAKGLLARVESENGEADVPQEFAYYPNGNVWKTKDAKSVVAKTVTYDVDYATMVKTDTNALGEKIETFYDALLRPIEVKDAAGVSSYRRYDVFGRVAQEWEYGDSEASPTKKYVYFDAASLPASPVYLQEELKNSESDYLTSRTYYDGMGRKVQTKRELETDEQYVAVDIHYDAAGRAYKTSIPYVSNSIDFNSSSERTAALRHHSITQFDAVGRPYLTTAADGSTSYLVYGKKYQAKIDQEGHATATETNGNETYSYVYDDLDYSGNSYAQMKSSFSYDKDSWYRRIRTLKARDGTVLAERSGEVSTENVITVSIDMLGRKTSYTDPDKGTWTYNYDANGNLVRQQDGVGNVLRFDYDAVNRPSKKYRGNVEAAVYTYTVTGKLAGASYSSGVDFYRYTPRGLRSGISRTIAGYGIKFVSTTYDSMNRPVTETYPDGETVTYTYNAGGNLETVTGASNYVTDIDYNELGKVTSLTFANGVTTTYAYDPLNGRMTGLEAGGILDYSYLYDLVGNITRKEDSLDSLFSEAYTYDPLYRLTSALGYQYGDKAYFYDAYNNLISKDGRYYSYPSVGGTRPHAVTSDGVNSYTYDANGNMVGGKGRAIVYDPENRVAEITKDLATTLFAYDDTGERTLKTVGTATTVYWSDSYEEKYLAGTLSEATKYYSANASTVAQRSTVSGLLFLHKDHLGSATKLTDGTGAVVQTIGYAPYGEQAYASGGDYTDYKYTGQEEDASTGLYYYHARYYDPELGRFIQADSMLDGMNRYAYCHNNPVMYTDPTGLYYDYYNPSGDNQGTPSTPNSDASSIPDQPGSPTGPSGGPSGTPPAAPPAAPPTAPPAAPPTAPPAAPPTAPPAEQPKETVTIVQQALTVVGFVTAAIESAYSRYAATSIANAATARSASETITGTAISVTSRSTSNSLFANADEAAAAARGFTRSAYTAENISGGLGKSGTGITTVAAAVEAVAALAQGDTKGAGRAAVVGVATELGSKAGGVAAVAAVNYFAPGAGLTVTASAYAGGSTFGGWGAGQLAGMAYDSITK
jgi:RHS repeat-associated protein